MEDFDWIKGFVLPYINFSIFLFLAIKFFKKPIREMFAKRKTEYEDLVKEVNQVKEAALEKKSELESRLANLNKEVSNIKENAEKEANLQRDKMLRDAKVLADHMVKEAKRVADAEVARAKVEIRERIMSEVRAGVVKKLNAELNDDQHTRLVGKAVDQVADIRLEN